MFIFLRFRCSIFDAFKRSVTQTLGMSDKAIKQ